MEKVHDQNECNTKKEQHEMRTQKVRDENSATGKWCEMKRV